MITRTAAATTEVATSAVASHLVVAGTPETGSVDIASPPGFDVGIWEHTVGTTTDVEVDEVFVVISGRATIAIDDGPSVEIGPGDVVTLAEGTATTWTVHTPLRKVYVTLA